MIIISHKGNLNKVTNFLSRVMYGGYLKTVEKYALEGVVALANATPIDTGLTAQSWNYKIDRTLTHTTIMWTNDNIQGGIPIAVILQYGHGTRNGGYVQGRDYINPAIRPVFDNIADKAWKEVTRV